jgi:hypothetical protein
MKIAIALVIFTAGLVILAALTYRNAASSAATGADPGREPAPGGDRSPVIVELFTSEGCSSCPPADAVLTRLVETQPVTGAEIIPLSEHVDYWNRLGWADPYSSAQFSERQSQYARVFAKEDVYTPQMVVDGQAEFVGSAMSRALDAVAKAARRTKAVVEVTAVETKSDQVKLRIRAELPSEISEGDVVEVILAITESDLRSSVSRGENAGRKLSHTAVVRNLNALGSFTSQGKDPFTAEPIVRLEKGWRPDRLRAVVFVQERSSRRILGAGVTGL